MLTSAVSLLLMPAPRSVLGGIAVTSLTLGTLGTSRGGFSVNHMDIAPKYAGVIMGISNTAGEGFTPLLLNPFFASLL
jgi:ACS family sodium-dependent inorganic phosphate cotransporter